MRREKIAGRLVSVLENRYGKSILEKKDDPFKVLISCVISQRTREENTDEASARLFSVADTPREIAALPTAKIAKLIKKAGFAKQKAERIKKIARILLEKHGGAVPACREALMELPGVGPKTADVTLCYGFGIPAIPVDTHVNRISRRLGLVPETAKIEEVGPALKKIFPKNRWRLINRGLVLFGREVCRPRYPKCDICELRRVCPNRKKSAG
ncbi:MAG: endonuclease III [Candidatus Hadarchaeales archaeon]